MGFDKQTAANLLTVVCCLLWIGTITAGNSTFCQNLPSFSGHGYLAFTGNITRLTVNPSQHVTADVNIVRVHKGDTILQRDEVKIRRVENAFSCGHQHELGDYRMWVVRRHTSGNLIAKASLEVTPSSVQAVLLSLTGMISSFRVTTGVLVPTLCTSDNCKFDGKCEYANGQVRCACKLPCTKQYFPVCGTDNLTYDNMCAMRLAECKTQSEITRQSFGPCGATSCAGLKIRGIAESDGEYLIYRRPECSNPIRIYCHGLKTNQTNEYLTLPAGGGENYAFVYRKRLPYYAREKCSGPAGKYTYSKAGRSMFYKVRIDLATMRLINTDFTFANSDRRGKKIPYGTAGDCFSMGPCRRGHFKVNLNGTGLRLRTHVNWEATGYSHRSGMQDYRKSQDGTTVSAKCGGWCGYCKPIGGIRLEETECKGMEIQCSAQNLVNGNVTSTDPNRYHGSKLLFECNDGYELIGADTLTCTKTGKWDRPKPYCKVIKCPDPGHIPNGLIYGRDFRIGQMVRFSCYAGYQLLGSVKRICLKSRHWDGALPVCDDGNSYCPALSTPINGMKYGSHYDQDDIVKFACEDRYVLRGSSVRVCMQNRQWNGTDALCIDENEANFKDVNETAFLLRSHLLETVMENPCKQHQSICTHIASNVDSRDRAIDIVFKGELDIVFVFDGSSSITKKAFNNALGFAKALVRIIGRRRK